MEHAYAGAAWGAVAFWLFVGVAAWAGIWEKTRRNAEKHETLRRIIEKTGAVDEARLAELFGPSKTSDWLGPTPGANFRGLRVAGTIVFFVAAGLAIFFIVMGRTGVIPQQASTIGLAASAVIAMLGVGLFVSSRFAEPPPDRGHDPAR